MNVKTSYLKEETRHYLDIHPTFITLRELKNGRKKDTKLSRHPSIVHSIQMSLYGRQNELLR